MELTRESIKGWMDKYYHSRRWLADKCGVSPATVSNWLTDTSKPIPKKQMVRIANLIKNNNIQQQNLVLWFDMDEFEEIEKAAYRDGLLIREWAEKELLRLARKFASGERS